MPARSASMATFGAAFVSRPLGAVIFGPMSAILPELYPTETRYTGSGIAYNVSSILGAALTPARRRR